MKIVMIIESYPKEGENAIAKVAEKNGMTSNDVMHLFPPILRMLKSDIDWSK